MERRAAPSTRPRSRSSTRKSGTRKSAALGKIIKIATMWNPAGAIIQLIETAWNVYQWVRENAQRIFGLVQAVVDSISNIVAGNKRTRSASTTT